MANIYMASGRLTARGQTRNRKVIIKLPPSGSARAGLSLANHLMGTIILKRINSILVCLNFFIDKKIKPD